jgi:hypothetical protein
MNKPVALKMSTTALVTTITIIVLGIYDLVCVTLGDTTISVSAFLINAGIQAPAVVFAFGYVCGHLFGAMKPVKAPEE